MKKLLLIAILVGQLAIAPFSWADTFFVAQSAAGDGSGSNYVNRASIATHNAGTGNFATLDGDTVYLCGTFDGTRLIPTDSGSSGNVIFYNGDCSTQGGSDAYFDFTGNTSAAVIDLDDNENDYITISGVTIRGGHYGVYCDGTCNYLTVIKSTFYDQDKAGVFNDGYGVGLVVGGSLANRNYFYDCGWAGTGSMAIQAGGSGGTVSWNVCEVEDHRFYDCVQAQTASNITVEYNISDGGREDGCDFKRCVDCVLRFNDFKNNKMGIQIQNDSDGVHCYGNKVSGSTDSGITVKDSSYSYGGTEDVWIWANLVYDCIRRGIMTDNTDAEAIRRINIYNNTIAENGSFDERVYETGGWVQLATSDYVWKNNIFYKNDPTNSNRRQLVVDDTTGINLDYNRYYHTGGAIKNRWGGTDYTFAAYQTASSQDANGSEGDPGFSNPASNDYSLDGDSVCRNIGTPTADDTNSHADRAKLLHPDSDIADWVNTVTLASIGSDWPMGAFIGAVCNKTSISSPTAGATGVSVDATMSSAAFSTNFPGTYLHKRTDWQLCTDGNCSNVVEQLLDSESSLTTWDPVATMNESTTYYIRAQHTAIRDGTSNEFDCGWSPTSSFTTEGGGPAGGTGAVGGFKVGVGTGDVTGGGSGTGSITLGTGS